MGFSANTRILTPDGYKSADRIRVGDILVSPLGDTLVTSAFTAIDERALKVTEGFTIVRLKTVLDKNGQWRMVGPSVVKALCVIGLLDQKWDAEVAMADLFRLPSENSPIEPFELPDMMPNIVIETENRTLIADGFICGAHANFNNATQPTEVTVEQIEELKNATN